MNLNLLILGLVAILFVGVDGRPRRRFSPQSLNNIESEEENIKNGADYDDYDDSDSELGSNPIAENDPSERIQGVSFNWTPDLAQKLKVILRILTRSKAINDFLEIMGKTISKLAYAIGNPDKYAPSGVPPPSIPKIIRAQNEQFAILPIKPANRTPLQTKAIESAMKQFPLYDKHSWQEADGVDDVL